MTIDESAKVMAVKYVLDYNTFRKSDKLKHELLEINMKYSDDKNFERLFDKYCSELRKCRGMMPLWARKIMAERYALHI